MYGWMDGWDLLADVVNVVEWYGKQGRPAK